jgi:hypothetical protein
MFDKEKMNFEIVVVASSRKKALVLQYLKDYPHKVSYTPDYNLPEDFEPEVKGLVQPCHQHHTNTYRCFRGHQNAIKLCTKENVLVFEDDAVPNTDDWINIVSDSVPLLDTFEMVSFHGRNYDRSLYENYIEIRPGNNFISIPKKIGAVFVCGALAYLLNRRTFEKVLSYQYNGMPIDILLVSDLSFCLLEKSPFKHDRSEGSLIDV